MTDQRPPVSSRALGADVAVFWPSIFGGLFAALIFAPVGLSMMGLIEEWDILYYFTKYGLFFISDEGSPLPTHRLRPFNITPFSIAYYLSPNSFVFYHFLQATALVIKAAAMASIIHWIFRNRRLAVIGGLIFLTYPADTMQMTLRSLHINWAVAMSVGAIALLLDGTERRTGWVKSVEIACASLCFLTASLVYEAGLFLAPLPLLFWWARFGWKVGWDRITRQITTVFLWVLGVGCAAGYLIIVSFSGANYQMSVTGDHATMLHDVVARLPFLVTITSYRLFAYGWYDGFRMLEEHLAFWPWLLVALCAIGSLYIGPFKLRVTEREKQISVFRSSSDLSSGVRFEPLWLTIRAISAGFVGAMFGYLPYLTSFWHMMTSQRTYLYAAVGATLVIVSLIYLAGRVKPVLGFGLVAVFLASGLGSQWHQMSVYTELSNRQRAIIAGVLEAAPDAAQPGAKRLLIFDRSGTSLNTWMLRGAEMRNALSFFYGSEVNPAVCSEPSLQFSSFLADDAGRPPHCRETETAWTIGEGLAEPEHLEKASLQTLIIESDLRVTRVGTQAPAAPADVVKRWTSLLGCWPAAACHIWSNGASLPPSDYDFGKYWGLDDVPWGSGWREIEWALPSLDPTSWSWMVEPQANLFMSVTPQPGRYEVRVLLYYWISQDSKASLRLSLNGKTLDASWAAPRTLTATVAASELRAGLNEVGLSALLDPKLGISVAVDRISVKHVEGSANN